MGGCRDGRGGAGGGRRAGEAHTVWTVYEMACFLSLGG